MNDLFIFRTKIRLKISKMYQISDFHEWHLTKCHTSALSQVITHTAVYRHRQRHWTGNDQYFCGTWQADRRMIPKVLSPCLTANNNERKEVWNSPGPGDGIFEQRMWSCYFLVCLAHPGTKSCLCYHVIIYCQGISCESYLFILLFTFYVIKFYDILCIVRNKSL